MTPDNNSVDVSLAFTVCPTSNNKKRDVEAHFFLCLPREAAVTNLDVFMGSNWVSASLQDRRNADYTYRTIVQEQRIKLKDPGLVEAVGNGIYRVRLFPILKHGMPVRIQWKQGLLKRRSIHVFRYAGKTFQTLGWSPSFRIQLSIGSEIDFPYIKPIRLKRSAQTKTPGTLLVMIDGRGLRIKIKKKMHRQNKVPILQQKAQLEKFWARYQTDEHLSWQELRTQSLQVSAVNLLRSLIALEPGMRMKKSKSYQLKNFTYYSDTGQSSTGKLRGGTSTDGFGGKNSVIIVPKKGGPEVFGLASPLQTSRFTKKYGSGVIVNAFNSVKNTLQKRQIRSLIPLFKRWGLFHFTQTSGTICNLANLVFSEYTSHIRDHTPGYDFTMQHAHQLLTKRKLLESYRLHLVVEFSHRMNIIRYGMSPWQLYYALFKSGSEK